MPKTYSSRKRRNAIRLYRQRNASRDPRTHMTLEQVAKLKRISSRTLRRWLDEDDRERERQTLAGIAGPPPLGSYHARIHLVIDVSAARPIVAAVPAGHREATKAWLRASLEEKVLADLVPRLRQDLRAQIVAEVEKLEGGEE